VDQLGLRLQQEKESAEVIVIDFVQRPPQQLGTDLTRKWIIEITPQMSLALIGNPRRNPFK